MPVSRRRFVVLAALGAAGCNDVFLTKATPAVVGDFTSDHESGNGTSFARVSDTEYTLRGEPDPDPNPPVEDTHWATPFDFIQRRGALWRAMTYRIDLEYTGVTAFGTNLTVNHFAPWYTYDLTGQSGWLPITTWSYDGSGEVLSMTTPILERDAVRIAEFPPYTLAQEAADWAVWEATGHCARLQIGTSYEGRPIYCYRITAAGSHVGKEAFILTGAGAGHEQERPSTWRCKGAIDYLVGDGAGASTLRGRRICYMVLRGSPDTYVHGRMRVNEQGIELNRWSSGAPNLAVDGVEQYAVRTFYEDLMAGNGLGGIVPSVFSDNHAAAGTPGLLSYAPGSSGLSTLPLSTYDTPGHWPSMTSDASWVGPNPEAANFSHRVMDNRFPAISAMVSECGLTKDEAGTRMTMAIAEAMGASFVRAIDDWMVSH